MHTLQLVYTIVSLLVAAFMCFVWSKNGLLNIAIKMILFCVMVLGIAVLVKSL